MKKFNLFLFSTLFFLFGIVANGFSQTATYTVTKTTDPDPKLYNFTDSLCAPEMYGTFQWAIRKSNDDGVSSNIVFNIPGSGVHTIYLTYEPPTIIWGDLIVDGTSQSGYQGTPLIVIDGQNKIGRGLYFHDYTNYTVKGLDIRNCTRRGILFEYANNILAEYNVITQIRDNDPNYSATAIRIVGNPKLGYTNATIRNNYLGTNTNLDTTLGCDDAGILVGPDANNNLIFGNTIAYNHQAGVYINYAIQNKLSQNLIFGQDSAIVLVNGANNDKAAPDSLQYNDSTQVLSGIAEPYDSIEVFGSTGAENANEYLGTTQADGSGNWSVQVQTTDSFLVATASNSVGNTSRLSICVPKSLRFSGAQCHSGTECNLIWNGDFSDWGTPNINPGPHDGWGAFGSPGTTSSVSGWGAAWVTPDIVFPNFNYGGLGGSPPPSYGDPCGYCYTGSNPSTDEQTWSEGAMTCIDFTNPPSFFSMPVKYILGVDLKTDRGPSTFFNFYFGLTRQIDYDNAVSSFSNTSINIISGSYELFYLTNYAAVNWETKLTYYQSSIANLGYYDRLYLGTDFAYSIIPAIKYFVSRNFSILNFFMVKKTYNFLFISL